LTGSRRLITYRRIPDAEVVTGATREQRSKENGVNANDLNSFRKGYFQGFKAAFR
jgi:tRNA (guanine10-N2)-methyltransferase